MKSIRVYDNGGKTFDRYTAVFTDDESRFPLYDCVGFSSNPFHPLGFCQHSDAMLGPHLGKRVSFASLPVEVQTMLREELKERSVIA